jgi:hypothetical protein
LKVLIDNDATIIAGHGVLAATDAPVRGGLAMQQLIAQRLNDLLLDGDRTTDLRQLEAAG